MVRTFKRGGVHPPEHKQLTERKPIETLPLPKRVVIPMAQCLGAPAEPTVKPKDAVKAGQRIGEPKGFVSTPVHASISGTVKKVDLYPTAVGARILSVEIESDGKDEWVEGIDLESREVDFTRPDDFLPALTDAGLVGMGGAAFPTHVKLKPPKDVKVDTLILNGAECEPYLTADHRLMLERAPEIALGLQILMAVLKVDRAYVGIEDNKPDAAATMRQALAGTLGVEVAVCRTRYPQGAEKQLIKSLTGREVPPGKLPMHVGCVVQNVGTAFAAFEAVARHKPLVERVLTVSGRAIREPKNLRVRIGTPLSDLVAFCGGAADDLRKLIFGGPMMGKALRFEDVPIVKSTSGILFFDREEAAAVREFPCIRCGRCVAACPQGLVPCDLGDQAEHGQYAGFADALDCVECGSCQFTCPAHRRLVHLLRLGKSEFRRLQKKG
ncbi:MAG: electron transport complex subunit RsxC [Deltaproteobacteria bacterium]|nr:electron transport complex subunit RsxC [Deltaproteobacteria bacterium]